MIRKTVNENRTFSEQDILCHEEVQPARNIRTDMGVGETADRMYNVDCITIRVHSAAFHNTAVKTCRHDPHQASVTVIPFLIAAAFLCFSIFLVSVDCLHCAAADIVGFSIRSKFSVVEPLHKVPHDIVEIDLSDNNSHNPIHPDIGIFCHTNHATEVCEDEILKLAMNLSFSASLRIGELCGLTWDCVDISQKAVEGGTCSIYINKEYQRVSKEAVSNLDGKDILVVFPSEGKLCTTVRVLKTPKTESSVRKIFIPKSVAEMLGKLRASQDEMKSILGEDYHKYDLVMATDYGLPIGEAAIRKRFKKLIKENNLPDVVFHSLRHTSVTYKLKLNGGDIKAIQGDSGHSQVNMVTDVYSHILDKDRKRNAELFEEAFYGKKNLNPQMIDAGSEKMITVPDGVDAETLMKVLGNPEMVALLSSLANTIQN